MKCKCDRTPVLSLIKLDEFNCLEPLQIKPEIAAAILADSYIYTLSLKTSPLL